MKKVVASARSLPRSGSSAATIAAQKRLRSDWGAAKQRNELSTVVNGHFITGRVLSSFGDTFITGQVLSCHGHCHCQACCYLRNAHDAQMCMTTTLMLLLKKVEFSIKVDLLGAIYNNTYRVRRVKTVFTSARKLLPGCVGQ